MKLMRLLTALVLPALTGLAGAQVQKCIDNTGKVLYTETACPNQASRQKVLKAPASSNGAAPAAEKNWAAENEAINKRQAQRDNNRAALDAFNRAVNAPLAPGQSRRVTLTLPAQ